MPSAGYTKFGLLAQVLMEIDPAEPALEKRYAGGNGGDHARLRGLRAIGRGVAGAMHGWDRLRALLAKESRQRRR